MAEKRGFSEPTYHGVNPLPAVTDDEVLTKAGLDLTTRARRLPFTIDWKHDFGENYEFIRLEPGDSVILRQSEIQGFKDMVGELGVAVFRIGCSPVEKAEAELEALRIAMNKYTEQGRVRLTAIKKTHGFSDQDMEDHKYDHWAYYYNQAKADILRDAVKAKQKEIAELKAKEKKFNDPTAENVA